MYSADRRIVPLNMLSFQLNDRWPESEWSSHAGRDATRWPDKERERMKSTPHWSTTKSKAHQGQSRSSSYASDTVAPSMNLGISHLLLLKRTFIKQFCLYNNIGYSDITRNDNSTKGDVKPLDTDEDYWIFIRMLARQPWSYGLRQVSRFHRMSVSVRATLWKTNKPRLTGMTKWIEGSIYLNGVRELFSV